MTTRPENRVALITGAGRGIGREIALALAKQGIIVCLMARTKSQVLEVYQVFHYIGLSMENLQAGKKLLYLT